jgi:hypothetical protein
VSGGRCSPTQAVNLLIPAFAPMAAAAELTQAIHDNTCGLYCDGVLVKPHIAAIARVVPKFENDERWTADIESTGPGLGWARGLPWELEVDEVMALRPQPDTKAEAMQTAAAAMAAEAAMAEAARVRAELEQARAVLQAATEQMEMAEARAEAAEARAEAAIDNPQRRRPGPKPKHPDWRLEVAVETHRLREKLRRTPSAGELAEFCQNKWDWEPDESDIRDLLRFLLRD